MAHRAVELENCNARSPKQRITIVSLTNGVHVDKQVPLSMYTSFLLSFFIIARKKGYSVHPLIHASLTAVRLNPIRSATAAD
jgi:hypothetical protein